jgi:voltage-gated hydrogen channel 1
LEVQLVHLSPLFPQDALANEGSYFKSWFHCFDALIVVASFVTDVVLHGVIEGASFIVALRLWRVVQIIEELSVGAQERTEEFEHEIDQLRRDVDQLRQEASHLKEELDKASPQSESSNAQPATQ